jgi:hypothetical protein
MVSNGMAKKMREMGKDFNAKACSHKDFQRSKFIFPQMSPSMN